MPAVIAFNIRNFYPRSPCGERRASQGADFGHKMNFYPRSPCGERLQWEGMKSLSEVISIHALLAESDMLSMGVIPIWKVFLSTLSLRRATGYFCRLGAYSPISIHALLAESDEPAPTGNDKHNIFLSTLSLRRATNSVWYPANSPLFLSTLSLRRATSCGWWGVAMLNVFLSTLSLRRATEAQNCANSSGPLFLSTLSLRRATPRSAGPWQGVYTDFYPRSPCGERRVACPVPCRGRAISIHALLAESDTIDTASKNRYLHFYPRSPCGERRRT